MLPNIWPLAGKFITFEGIEGVGKTTNVQFVYELLQQQKVPALATREPGGTYVGEQIRRQLLHLREEKLTAKTELLLLFAAREQHLELVINPALAAGKCVLCDRFTDASYAYQGGGRGVAQADIAAIENFVQADFRPNFTIIFDAPVDVALDRARARKSDNASTDRFESEKIEFFNKVRNVYLERAKFWPGRYHVIDAARDLAAVQAELTEIFTAKVQCNI